MLFPTRNRGRFLRKGLENWAGIWYNMRCQRKGRSSKMKTIILSLIVMGVAFGCNAADLKEESFRADNVTATLSVAEEDGKLAVQITPVEGDKQFFIRVKMTP